MPSSKSSDVTFNKFWKKYEETDSIVRALICAIGYAIPGQIIFLLIFNLSQVIKKMNFSMQDQ